MTGLDRALWRAVAVFRVLSLGYAGGLIAHHHGVYDRPAVAWSVFGGMVVWTAVATTLYAIRAPRPGSLLLGVDLALAAGAVLATRAALSAERIVDGDPTLPVSWAAAPVLAWAIAAGPLGGGLAGLAVAAADLVERWSTPSEATINGVVLLLLGGLVVGYVVQLARSAQAQLAGAVEIEAARRERDRLAARIHDSVLQVLALVARRAGELGGDAAELGRLAGEQEIALRTLVVSAQQPPTVETTDLRALLAPYESSTVSLAAPAEPVLVPTDTARELADAVAAALDNVARHAGATARAWVLIEDDGAAVVVTVRDDGVGFPAGRLEAAADSGRLGIDRSIRGRIRALGGEATLTSSPGDGTEVEMRVPRAHQG